MLPALSHVSSKTCSVVTPRSLPVIIALLSLVVSAEERKSKVEAFLDFAHWDWYVAKALSAQAPANEMQASMELLMQRQL